MLKAQGQIDAEAIGWVIRLRDASSADWEAFTVWLEADPEHLAAYELAAAADAGAEGLAEPVSRPEPAWRPEDARAPARHGRRAFLGWGIAASLAVAAGWTQLPGAEGGAYSIQTAAGERRSVDLPDGSRIALNGGTRIVLDKARPRFARIERGEALFDVVHDDMRPFEVEAGDALMRDMGTVFNVMHDGEALEVAVAEGAVLFNPGRESKSLRPGMALRQVRGAPLWVGRAEGVGAWREGRLVYASAPASRVAADLSRNLGVTVSVRGAAGELPFSGVIALDGPPREVLGRAAALLGMRLSRAGSGWTLSTGTGASS
jgi:transmembrane sensor